MAYFIPLLILIVTILHFSTSLSDTASAFVYLSCPPNSRPTPDNSDLNSLLASIATAAASSLFFTSPSPLHGLFQCRDDLPQAECTSCVRSAIVQLPVLCPSSSSAALQLHGCLLRYSTEDFVGRPDLSLRFRRCASADSNHDSALVEMRDAVLSGLVEEEGMYRERRVGYVGGVAQCVGDQSLEDCEECVAEAVTRAKEGCGGSSAAGEVYLGKCYVEYSPWRLHLPLPGTSNNNMGYCGEGLVLLHGEGWWWWRSSWRLCVTVVAALSV